MTAEIMEFIGKTDKNRDKRSSRLGGFVYLGRRLENSCLSFHEERELHFRQINNLGGKII